MTDKRITVTDAVLLTEHDARPANGRTIRWACAHGWIDGAERDRRGWTFTEEAFTDWYRNRPKPGRK